jgi:hypothetical protein
MNFWAFVHTDEKCHMNVEMGCHHERKRGI